MQTKRSHFNGWKNEAAYDLIELLVLEHLQEHYLMCLDWDDIEQAADILSTIRYFSTYDEFTQFLNEVRDAGYSIERK